MPVERRVLADLLPRTLVRDIGLVIAVAALTALAAQVRIPVPGSPVPITGQTFAVLLGAAAVGPLRGSLAQVLYLLVGILGVPVFTGGEAGFEVMTGATGGYIVGFVLASAVVGALARRGADRRPVGAVVAFVAGTAVIYAIGLPWLMATTGMSFGPALAAGVTPFLFGDALKALAAGALLPGAWRLVERD
jgi:biotin transport system substrate-specific component